MSTISYVSQENAQQTAVNEQRRRDRLARRRARMEQELVNLAQKLTSQIAHPVQIQQKFSQLQGISQIKTPIITNNLSTPELKVLKALQPHRNQSPVAEKMKREIQNLSSQIENQNESSSIQQIRQQILKAKREIETREESLTKQELIRIPMFWKDLDLVKKSATLLGYQITSPSIITDGLEQQKVDITLVKDSNKIGIVKQKQGVEVVFHDSKLKEQFVQPLAQQYAYEKTITFLKSKGYGVDQAQKLPSGEIRITGIKF